MIKKQINQKHRFDIELLNSIGHDYVFNNSPINRLKNKINSPKKSDGNKHEKLIRLKQEIDSIEECKLTKKCIKNRFCRRQYAKFNYDSW